MEQLFWIWSLLPSGVITWLNNIIIIVGVVGASAGFLGRWIPFFSDYARFLRPLGIVLLVGGVYLKGGEANNDMWLARVAELEAKVAIEDESYKLPINRRRL